MPKPDYKRVLRRVFERDIGVLAIENPLVPDTVAGLVCPNCGEMQANVQQANDAQVELSGEEDVPVEFAVCGVCGAEFDLEGGPEAEAVIEAVLSGRETLQRRLARHPIQESSPLVYFLTR